jgi:hypothetical protein
MIPAVARRFPLVARPRPACPPLPQRVDGISDLARHAVQTSDPASATAVFNLAALLASDCDLPELARTWCHRLAATAIEHDHDPQHALEPIVNLARLHIRAGDGPAAWVLLETLFQAVESQTDVTIDGLPIPVTRLTSVPASHAKTRRWLWGVLLGTGAHALASAGRWDEASTRLAQHNGIGERMLDGRQVAVIAHTEAGRGQQARTMLGTTRPGEPWENAVTATLRLHVNLHPHDAFPAPAEVVTAALTAHNELGPAQAGLSVFHTRLGLTLIDGIGADHPDIDQITTQLLRDAANDGYAAREILEHRGCLTKASPDQVSHLSQLVADCGLGRRTIDPEHRSTLNHALETAESVITHQSLQIAAAAALPAHAPATPTAHHAASPQRQDLAP